MKLKISIVILIFNKGEYLYKNDDSLLGPTFLERYV